MNFWIEVTSGMRWHRMYEGKDIALSAPIRTRYLNFFNGVMTGDTVLHYLTTALTRSQEQRSSVVAVSGIASDPAEKRRIEAKCSNTVLFPKPVSYSELRSIQPKSREFEKLVARMSMQRYLTQMTKSDFESVLKVHPENWRKFLKSPLSKRR